jgi:hypothetical protein
MTDVVEIVLPAQEDYRHIVHLVAGGLAARLDLTFERLEDLQLALESLLACRNDEEEIVVTVAVEHDRLRTTVGPFTEVALADLASDGPELGLRRVLETVADGYDVTEDDEGSWVHLTKRTMTAGAPS